MEHDAAEQQRRRATFDGAADAYDARPGYPAVLFERLTSECGVGPGCALVEIGPGTGQATRALLDLGCAVTAIELGAAMAERLAVRTNGRCVEIVTSSFEDADLPEASFDVVLAATSFHWVDPAVGVPKAHTLLRSGGSLVLVWNVFGDPSRPDPFHEALDALLQEIEPEIADLQIPGPHMPDGLAWAGAIDEHHLFEPARGETFHWTGTHSTAELIALFSTFSPWISRGPDRLPELLDALANLSDEQFGGQVTRPYHTVLVTARKA